MVKQVQELIDKIKREGVEAGEKKAQDIEQLAKLQGEKIVKDAQKKAQEIIEQAKGEAKKLEDSAKMSIKQASRDMILSLRKEIVTLLGQIVLKDVHSSLASDALLEIIKELILKSSEASVSSVRIELSLKDKEKLTEHVLAKLQKEIKKEIVIHSAEDISAGLRISFDKGKSSFDFSDQSLAEYLSLHLNPQISALLKDASKTK
jgi:V/A-type H+-transporting ATPase subunit E